MKTKLFLSVIMAIALVACETDNGQERLASAPEGVQMVDLGLSVKWANMNVGATQPEENGDYFAWGETKPKAEYAWAAYNWCQGSSETLTKYCIHSEYGYNGFTDEMTVLALEDDAAHVNWGGDWRMPTKAEQDELRTGCNWTWTDNWNGTRAKGYIVSSKTNDNSIFLPAAGSRGDSSYGVGSYGYYWSSSLNMNASYYAFYLNFNSDGIDWYRSDRYYGQSVRPVCK